MIMALAVAADDSKFMLLHVRVVAKSTFCRLWKQFVLYVVRTRPVTNLLSLVLFVLKKKRSSVHIL